MLSNKKQINKGTVKKQTNKSMVYECLVCGKKEIATKRPTTCVCSNNGNYVVNKSYEVKE